MLFYYTLYTECMQNMMLSSDAWDSEEFECLVENGSGAKPSPRYKSALDIYLWLFRQGRVKPGNTLSKGDCADVRGTFWTRLE